MKTNMRLIYFKGFNFFVGLHLMALLIACDPPRPRQETGVRQVHGRPAKPGEDLKKDDKKEKGLNTNPDPKNPNQGGSNPPNPKADQTKAGDSQAPPESCIDDKQGTPLNPKTPDTTSSDSGTPPVSDDGKPPQTGEGSESPPATAPDSPPTSGPASPGSAAPAAVPGQPSGPARVEQPNKPTAPLAPTVPPVVAAKPTKTENKPAGPAAAPPTGAAPVDNPPPGTSAAGSSGGRFDGLTPPSAGGTDGASVSPTSPATAPTACVYDSNHPEKCPQGQTGSTGDSSDGAKVEIYADNLPSLTTGVPLPLGLPKVAKGFTSSGAAEDNLRGEVSAVVSSAAKDPETKKLNDQLARSIVGLSTKFDKDKVFLEIDIYTKKNKVETLVLSGTLSNKRAMLVQIDSDIKEPIDQKVRADLFCLSTRKEACSVRAVKLFIPSKDKKKTAVAAFILRTDTIAIADISIQGKKEGEETEISKNLQKFYQILICQKETNLCQNNQDKIKNTTIKSFEVIGGLSWQRVSLLTNEGQLIFSQGPLVTNSKPGNFSVSFSRNVDVELTKTNPKFEIQQTIQDVKLVKNDGKNLFTIEFIFSNKGEPSQSLLVSFKRKTEAIYTQIFQ